MAIQVSQVPAGERNAGKWIITDDGTSIGKVFPNEHAAQRCLRRLAKQAERMENLRAAKGGA